MKDLKNRVKDNDEKINITLSYIEGDKVSDFIQNIYDRYWFDADKEWTCSYTTLMEKLDERFLEVSRHEDAREAFDWIKMMPGERAEMFFERFEVTAGIAEYDLDEKHVIKKLEKAVKTAIIDSIYHGGNLPKKYADWKTRVVDIDNLWRYREEQKKAWSFGNFWKPSQEKQQPQAAKTPATVTDKKDGSGTTFGGGGRPMELDKARQMGACFNCGKKGHIAKFCLEPKKAVVRGVSTEIEDKPRESPVPDITLLRSMFAKQSDEEKAKLLDEWSGFLKGQQ